jgi:hypothetical protein
MPLECRLNHAALHSPAAAMNDSDLAQAAGMGFGHVFLDDRDHISRAEGVKVEQAVDGKLVRFTQVQPFS